MPVPFSMWRPWVGEGALPAWFDPQTAMIDGRKTTFLICYEHLLIWPPLVALSTNPDVLVGMSNDWWARDTNIPAIQRSAMVAWARLFAVQLVLSKICRSDAMDLPIDQCVAMVSKRLLLRPSFRPESGGNPWAINVNVRDDQAQPLLVPARSRDEAVAQATRLHGEGYSFDVGLMQVNSANVVRLGVPFDTAFDVYQPSDGDLGL